MGNLKDLNLENKRLKDELKDGSKRTWKKAKGFKENQKEIDEFQIELELWKKQAK